MADGGDDRRLDWNARTFLRVFLVAGGVTFIVSGTIEESLLNLGIGILALAVGATGLWQEYAR